MDIEKLLTKSTSPSPPKIQTQPQQRPLTLTTEQNLIHEERLMKVWEQQLYKGGFILKSTCERNTLTDCYISRIKKHSHHTTSTSPPSSSKSKLAFGETPIHVKIIGRHMNGSFRCHIGTGKQSRPIQTMELSQQMRMMVVFFRVENSKSPWVMTDFLFFPTWLLHLFRYAHYDGTPGRTDVRFLENAALAKEDHIYRLNHVLNSLFRFQLYCLDYDQLDASMRLANYLFDTAGLNPMTLPRPHLILHDRDDETHRYQCTTASSCDLDAMTNTKTYQHNHHQTQPSLYASLILLLHAPRPTKIKTMCTNCNTKPSSRRQLCVACYRYQLKHNEPRPLRLIVANRPGPRSLSPPMNNPMSSLSPPQPSYSYSNSRNSTSLIPSTSSSSSNVPPLSPTSPTSPTSSVFENHQRLSSTTSGKKKSTNKCVNCGVTKTHQWYRNLCGEGHWCETCKSYYLRHGKIRPPELFVKAAKRKVDVRSWMDWTSWCLDDATVATATMAINKESQQRRWSSLVMATNSSQLLSPPSTSSASSSSSVSPKKSTVTSCSDYELVPSRHSYAPTTSSRSSSYFAPPTTPIQLPPPPTSSSRYSASAHQSPSKSYARYSMPIFESPTISTLSGSKPAESSTYIKKECRQPTFTHTKPCRRTSSYIMTHQNSP